MCFKAFKKVKPCVCVCVRCKRCSEAAVREPAFVEGAERIDEKLIAEGEFGENVEAGEVAPWWAPERMQL